LINTIVDSVNYRAVVNQNIYLVGLNICVNVGKLLPEHIGSGNKETIQKNYHHTAERAGFKPAPMVG
jgi:hypothetical protein